MPTNLPPEAILAEKKYLEADTLPEKIIALQEYISKIPKHKGTEKLLSLLKTKLAKLKEKAESLKKLKKGSGKHINIRKEGAGQVVLVGLTNCGKSSILNELTGSKAKIASYPFTTSKPEVGMLEFGGVYIQIVEAPALFDGATTSPSGPPIFSVIRNADAICIVLDLSSNPIEQLKIILDELEQNGIKINCEPPKVRIKKTGSGGLQFLGLHYFSGEKEDLLEILKEAGVINAVIQFYDKTDLTQFSEALDEKIVYRPALIIGNKGDLEGSSKSYQELISSEYNEYPTVAISCLKRKNIGNLKREVFKLLKIIRVYTKETDGTVSERPLVLRDGATVEDVAKRLHQKFIKKFKYAKIFGDSAKFLGEKVGLEHELKDNDIIQIFTK
ncbi:MAG: GTPase [Candidatus Odinarchaeia archaeon]